MRWPSVGDRRSRGSCSRRHDNCSTIVYPHSFPFRPYLGPELLYSHKANFPVAAIPPLYHQTVLEPLPYTRSFAVFTMFRTMHVLLLLADVATRHSPSYRPNYNTTKSMYSIWLKNFRQVIADQWT